MTGTVAFDLDGCLIDSGPVITQAYREAGAEPPGDFLALGHHDWIEPARREAVHAAKNLAYLRLLSAGGVPRLPPWQVAERLHAEGHTVVMLTGAPHGAAGILALQYPSWPFTAWAHALSPAAKAGWLESAGAGVYVDDQQYVKVPVRWRFVLYMGQDADWLYAQVTR